MRRHFPQIRSIAALLAIVMALPTIGCVAEEKGGTTTTAAVATPKKYRGLLRRGSDKVRREGGKTLLWAGGARPPGPDTQWYDFTGSVIPPEELQFGIGKDRIRAIDDPLFVSADDPRLLKLAHSRYRRDQKPTSNDQIRVIGYVNAKDARAYPVALLDHHELVNDVIGGTPLTVGW